MIGHAGADQLLDPMPDHRLLADRQQALVGEG